MATATNGNATRLHDLRFRKPVSPAQKVETPYERLVRERGERLVYLRSSKGKGEVHEALLQIKSESADERLKGAKALTGLKAPEAFEPMLAVAEKEQDKAIKLKFLEVLITTIDTAPIRSPKTIAERVKDLILQETDPAIVKKAALLMCHCGPNRKDAFDNLMDIQTRIDQKRGPGPLSTAVSNVMCELVGTFAL